MSRRSRIFLGIVVVYVAAVGVLLVRIGADIDPRYRESSEEALVDTANLLATLLERRAFDGVIPTDDLDRTLAALGARAVDAQIYDVRKTRIDLHVYVTDARGTVLYDSHGEDVGADYSAWRDVKRTLSGSYGARTTITVSEDPSSAVMYVGAPIRERVQREAADPGAADPGATGGASGMGGAGSPSGAGERIIGMVAVGKPVAAIRPYIAHARTQLAKVGALSAAAIAVLLLLAALWLVRPFGLVRDLLVVASRGGGSAGQRARRFGQALRTAFADMRDALAGRSYVDEYVQTLAHELKSPLAAIRGAAELLGEPMPEDARARFAGNINEQVRRAQSLIDRMLELSSLERRGALERVERIAVGPLLAQVRDEQAAVAQRRGVRIEVRDMRHHAAAAEGVAQVDPALQVSGDPFLVQRALGNLVKNAVEFAPTGSAVTIAVDARPRDVRLSVRDHGPGLPEFARERVFQKFFSLPRPDTGRKGTGLGLAFVREVAALHGGRATLDNHPDGGAIALLALPRASARITPLPATPA